MGQKAWHGSVPGTAVGAVTVCLAGLYLVWLLAGERATAQHWHG
jgi:ABC-type enterobactin transport system permease subunit